MKGEILALIAALLWGIAPLFDRIVASSGVSPYVANLVRATGAIVFLILATIAFGFDLSALNSKNVAYLIVAGALGGGVAMILYYMALRFSQASRVVPITSIYPLFTVLLSSVILGERVGVKVLIGTVLIVLGVTLVCGD